MSVVLKRIYDEGVKTGGYRVLVDRVWPRGISKAKSQLDEWAKIISPSPSLRKWFNHDPERYEEFKVLYWKELNDSDEAKGKFKELQEKAINQRVILLYGAKNPKYNHAVILKDWLKGKEV